ncbi:ABC transporter permease [Pilimelia columellifera]|uniref:ABC transporter permease n=1 Tax=Pilimelia columellifera subsp. columellifera TaxID=706583 RepID=A0ABP6ANL5_9ACTN
MAGYILKRGVSALLVVLVTLLLSFAMFFLAPKDPIGAICGPRCTPERAAEISQSLHLDDPVTLQFAQYVKGIVAGHTITSGGATVDCPAPCLGYSFRLGQPVTKLLMQAMPITVSIVVGAAVVYLTIGILSGILAARRRGTSFDKSIVAGTLGLSSVPYFIVALLVVLYTAGTFLPPSQYSPFLDGPLSWASGLTAAWLTLGVVNAAAYARYSRASMIEALGEDYIRTARAKGISERRVVYRHGLRSALTPVATIFGLDLAGQLTGALFTERIFGLPGLGVVTLEAFKTDDLPVMMGGILLGSVLLVTLNLMVDILYTFLDPRVRLG